MSSWESFRSEPFDTDPEVTLHRKSEPNAKLHLFKIICWGDLCNWSDLAWDEDDAIFTRKCHLHWHREGQQE